VGPSGDIGVISMALVALVALASRRKELRSAM
jgi:hypothetical protein